MNVKIVTAPSVHVVGSSRVDRGGLDGFLEAHGLEWQTDTTLEAQELVEVAGRLCYMSFARPRPGGNAAYVGHILEVGHGSVLEHAAFNLVIAGVSRSLTHELVRHRAGFSYSQLSQRYVDEGDVAFVVPPAMLCYMDHSASRAEVEAHNGACYAKGEYDATRPFPPAAGETAARWHRWLGCIGECLATYRDQAHCFEQFHPTISKIGDGTARRKAAREAARSVLPNCTETKIFVTANARALRNFLELRGSLAADAEIRRLAVAILGVVNVESPDLFRDFVVRETEDGVEYLTNQHHKV